MPRTLGRTLVSLLLIATILMTASAVVKGIRYIQKQETLNVDSALFAEIARVDLNGGTLYVDRWDNKPPVVFWVLEPFIHFLGHSVLTINLAIIVQNLLFGAGVAFLIYAVTRSSVATLCGLSIALLFVLPVQKVETTALMSALGAGAVGLAVSARGRPFGLFLSGVVFAFGVLTKQPLVVEFPILLLFAVEAMPGKRRVAILSVVAGSLVTALIFGLWLLARGNAEPFIRHVVLDSYAYVFHNAGAEPLKPDRSRFDETWPRFLVLAPFVIASAWILIRRRSRLAGLALLWFVVTAAVAATGSSLKFAYFIQTMPSLCLLIALAVAGYRQWSAPARIGVLIASLVAVFVFADYFILPPTNASAEALDAASHVVQEHSTASDCLWLWSQFNDVSFLAGRASCSAVPMDIHTVKTDQFDTRRYQNEMLLDLFHHPARLHVLYSNYLYFPQLARFAERYRKQPLFEDTYQIYEVDMSAWHASTATFGDTASLIGYDWPPRDRVCPGDRLPLALTWQRGSAPGEGVERVVRLLAPDGHTVAATNSIPLADEWPMDVTPQAGDVLPGGSFESALSETSPEDGWPVDVTPQVGDVLLGGSFELTLPETSPAGRYSLRLALRPAAGSDSSTGSEIELQAVTVDAC